MLCYCRAQLPQRPFQPKRDTTHRRPDLHDAACMVTLREKLGFADALVTTYEGFNGPGSEHDSVRCVPCSKMDSG